MRCDELNRWLDEGAPEREAAAARAHAAGCADCARAIEAFAALERSLASPPPAPPNAATFTSRVMERLERPEPSAAPAAAALPKPKLIPWWIAIFSEPAFAVALVASFLLLTTPAALRLEAGKSLGVLLTVASESIGAQFAQAMHAWFEPLAFLTNLSAVERFYLFVGFLPFFVWGGIRVYRSFMRFLRPAPVRRG